MADKLTPHEALVLDALSYCDGPVDMKMLDELADPRQEKLCFGELQEIVAGLLAKQLVTPITGQGDVERTYCITNMGRARLVASEARKVFGERVTNHPTRANGKDYEPIRATCCHRAGPEPELPATALICLDEDELDDWWEALDVEMKADAFAQFALHMHLGEDSHVYIAPRQAACIPVIGTVGETAAEWMAKAETFTTLGPEICSYCGASRSIPWAYRQSGPKFIRAACAKCRPLFDADNKADDAKEVVIRNERARVATVREENIAAMREAELGGQDA